MGVSLRNVKVAGVRRAGRGRKTWYECVKGDMKKLDLHEEWAVYTGICGGASYREECLTLAERGRMSVLKINDDDDDN